MFTCIVLYSALYSWTRTKNKKIDDKNFHGTPSQKTNGWPLSVPCEALQWESRNIFLLGFANNHFSYICRIHVCWLYLQFLESGNRTFESDLPFLKIVTKLVTVSVYSTNLLFSVLLIQQKKTKQWSLEALNCVLPPSLFHTCLQRFYDVLWKQ